MRKHLRVIISIALTVIFTSGAFTGVPVYAATVTVNSEEVAKALQLAQDGVYTAPDWVHGFYAFSSYAQREYIKDMDAVTFGWSAMEWDAVNGARLNTTAANGNGWRIPDSYELITEYALECGVTTHLGVYMDAAMGLNGLLGNKKARNKAVDAIINEASRVYDKINRSPYTGVTVDFEGLKGEKVKTEYILFLTQLAEKLRARGMTLYVTVQPVTADGIYFDGYDYKTIGQLADKVILMAHDFQPLSMDGFVGTDWQKNAALTPITNMYTALKAITDKESGVEDGTKITLAFNLACVGWRIDGSGKVISPDPVTPAMETVIQRMRQPGTVFGWSEVYHNPYMTYTTENNERIYLWYEDARSITEKIDLAGLFGVTGVSVWRMGTIPGYAEWNVWTAINNEG